MFWNSPSWRASEWWAAAFLVAPFVVGAIVLELRQLKPSAILGLIAGTDGRWSTSKTSNVLWVFAVAWAFIAIILHSAGSDLGGALDLKNEYLIVLGIPTGTAVLAKAVTKGNVASGKVSTKPSKGPETNVASGLGQLVGTDAGSIDLLDLFPPLGSSARAGAGPAAPPTFCAVGPSPRHGEDRPGDRIDVRPARSM